MSIIKRVVLVSGASKGIGKAIALRAGREGAFVVVNYNSDAQGATDVVAELGAENAIAVQADISQPSEVERLIQQSIQRFGKIDVVVPNAACMPLTGVETVTETQFDLAFGVNVKGPCFLVQVCLFSRSATVYLC